MKIIGFAGVGLQGSSPLRNLPRIDGVDIERRRLCEGGYEDAFLPGAAQHHEESATLGRTVNPYLFRARGEMWKDGYFACTAGGRMSSEVIQKYIFSYKDSGAKA